MNADFKNSKYLSFQSAFICVYQRLTLFWGSADSRVCPHADAWRLSVDALTKSLDSLLIGQAVAVFVLGGPGVG